MEIQTVISNGIFQESNTKACKTIATKYKRNAAPKILEIKKNNAPDMCDTNPNLVPRYS